MKIAKGVRDVIAVVLVLAVVFGAGYYTAIQLSFRSIRKSWMKLKKWDLQMLSLKEFIRMLLRTLKKS